MTTVFNDRIAAGSVEKCGSNWFLEGFCIDDRKYDGVYTSRRVRLPSPWWFFERRTPAYGNIQASGTFDRKLVPWKNVTAIQLVKLRTRRTLNVTCSSRERASYRPCRARTRRRRTDYTSLRVEDFVTFKPRTHQMNDTVSTVVTVRPSVVKYKRQIVPSHKP